ncbi:hypothetical protein [uncultured Chloroflexus sp.]|uniref:hypothetical protein n=2 Tax=uncultured Chloroflexus sp. TaxID=214040 RepID=UPI0026337C3D|nr:hypothetical protein [uncultured Chloroflexus sp.]
MRTLCNGAWTVDEHPRRCYNRRHNLAVPTLGDRGERLVIMGFFDYFVAVSPTFGSYAWTFFIVQILLVAGGAYFIWLHTERNVAKATFFRQLGIALMIVGGFGVALGVARMLNTPTFNLRFWFYIQFVIELILGGYVFYYMRNVLPELVRNSRTRAPTPRQVPADATPATPRPVATTGRREARRERKRKQR